MPLIACSSHELCTEQRKVETHLFLNSDFRGEALDSSSAVSWQDAKTAQSARCWPSSMQELEQSCGVMHKNHILNL